MNSLTESFAAPLRAVASKFDRLQGNNSQYQQQQYHSAPPPQHQQQYYHTPPPQQHYSHSPQPHNRRPRASTGPNRHTQHHHSHHHPSRSQGHLPQRQQSARFRISKNEIRNLTKDLMIMQILRPARSSGWALSQRPTITLVKANGQVFSHIRFRSISTSSIELDVNDRATKMTKEDFEDSWRFEPSFAKGTGEVWSWQMKDGKGTLRNLRKAEWVVARIDGEELFMEIPGMSDVEYDEIVASGVALVEKGRKGSGFAMSAFGDVVEHAMSEVIGSRESGARERR